MRWLNLDSTRDYFPRRAKIFTIGKEIEPQFDALLGVLQRIESVGPANLEQFARSLIKRYRPNLSCCTIFYFGFDAKRRQFQIGVEHPGLAPVPDSQEVPAETLLQDVCSCGRSDCGKYATAVATCPCCGNQFLFVGESDNVDDRIAKCPTCGAVLKIVIKGIAAITGRVDRPDRN